MSISASIRPLALRREGEDFLAIDWSDGHHGRIAWQHLRDNCPCAGCKEEKNKPADPFRILKPEELVPLKPVAIDPIGHYAYRITWSDGHDTGLFKLDLLRQLCQCPECQKVSNDFQR